MQVRINGQSVVFEYASNAEIARHIAIITQLLQQKFEDPRRMIVHQMQMVNAQGETAGEVIHRTEF